MKKFNALKILIATYVAGFMALALHTKWADSEIWAVSIARTLGFQAWDYGLSYKPLFYMTLRSVYSLDLSNVETFTAARLLYAAVGLGVLLLTYRLGRLLKLSFEARTLAVFLLATSSFFLERGFRVRSDQLATLFQLLGLTYYFQYVDQHTWGKPRTLVVSALLHVSLLLSTPKAIYQLLVNFYVYRVSQRFFKVPETQKRHSRRVTLIFALAIPFSLFAVLAYFRTEQVLSALTFFVRSFAENPSQPAYFSLSSFQHYRRFVLENPLFILAGLVAVYWSLKNKIERKPSMSEFPLGGIAALTLFFIIFHNDRLPFFLVSLLPLVALFMGQQVVNVIRGTRLRILLVGLVLNGLFHGVQIWKSQSNDLQRAAIVSMQNYLAKYPGVLYYDGTAVLPRNNQLFANAEPKHLGNDDWLLKLLNDDKPDLFFFGNRLHHYFGRIMSFLDHENYIQIGPGVFARSKVSYYDDPRNFLKHTRAELCKGVSDNMDGLKLYTGDIFVEMEPWDGASVPKKLVACSRFSQIDWPTELSFAKIFDF